MKTPGFTLDEVRVLGLAAPTILKFLANREERLLRRIHGELKNGKHDQLAALSEFAAIRDITNDITAALRVHEKHEEDLHAADTKHSER